MSRTSAVLFACGALVVGAVITALYLNRDCEPDYTYVLDLQGAKFKSPAPPNQEAFKAAIAKATFRRGVNLRWIENGPTTTPTGYTDVGLTCFSLSKGKPAGGLHVTQRLAFDNKTDLQKALDQLK